MSNFYQELDRHFLDYRLEHVDGIRWPVRGPVPDLDRPFFACIGAAQTFGRFCPRPFPAQLQDDLDLPVLNLAIGGTGPALYRQPELLRVLRRARFVVAQIMSGRSASNSRFRTAGGILGEVVDTGEKSRLQPLFAEWLRAEPRAVVERLVRETRADYTSQFRALLRAIGRPTVLFWFSRRAPDYTPAFGSVGEVFGEHPDLVDRQTLAAIAGEATALVECTSQRGFPQRLWRAETAVEGTHRRDDGWLYSHYPSPEMHADAAAALHTTCRELARQEDPAPLPKHPVVARDPRWFVLVGAERTGTNLLLSLLADHPDIDVAGELFNPVNRDAPIPWEPVRERIDLVGLRHRDRRSFLLELWREARLRRREAFGFKLLYAHAMLSPDVVPLLRTLPGLRVIHLVRENRLQRLVSHQRAQESGRWVQREGAGEPAPAPPAPVELAFDACVEDFLEHLDREDMAELWFGSRPVLRLRYEDLAADPDGVADEAVAFLGLPLHELRPGTGKLGDDPLPRAIRNHDALRAEFATWLRFFDE